MSGLTEYMELVTYDPDGTDINVPGKDFVSGVAGTAETSNMSKIDKFMSEKPTYIVKSTSEWMTDSTTILRTNDIGVASDTNAAKRGDGVSTWANLPYSSYPLPADGTEGQVLIKTGSGALDFDWSDKGADVAIDYYDVTLTVAGWTAATSGYTQTITISSMDVSGQYNVSVVALDGALAWKYGVVATSATGNQIVFTADELPAEEIKYTAEVLEVSGS